jgi:hypothetical protein
MANTEFTTINDTPVRVTLTPYEMKTLISSLKHSLETNPQLNDWSSEARLYDEFTDMLNSTYERLKGDCDYSVKYNTNTQTSKLVLSERADKVTAADAKMAEV